MIYFTRNTHDENGNYKWSTDKLYSYSRGLGVHALNRSGIPTTLEKYLSEHYSYKRSFPDYKIPSHSDLLRDLADLIDDELVLMEFIE